MRDFEAGDLENIKKQGGNLYFLKIHPKFTTNAEQELSYELERYSLLEFFEGNALLQTNVGSDLLYAILTDSIFVENYFPIHVIQESELSKVIRSFKEVCEEKLKKEKTFAIRTIAYASEIHTRDLEVQLGEALEQIGYEVDREHPDQFVFCALFKGYSYGSVLPAGKALYPYLDVAKRWSREGKYLNSAQLKLLEAIERFNITISSCRSLDVGAAPGGWSEILLNFGCMVYGIDPAEVKPKVKERKDFIHLQAKIEEIDLDRTFDLITCDINVGSHKAARMMLPLSKHLKKDGRTIMTLKLPTTSLEYLEYSLEILRQAYEIERVKHLSMNKSEVTTLLSRK